MSEKRTLTVELTVPNGSGGMEVAAALRRVGEAYDIITATEPHNYETLTVALRRAEITVKDVCMPELEFAAYLSGVARGLH
jgi:hypothetical protein